MTTCLIVAAHADDELLWFHPWLLDRSLTRKVLICCADTHNPERQSYSRGEEALGAVCADVGVSEYRVLNSYFSEFYKLRTRGAGTGPLLKGWWNDAQAAVREMMDGCDFLVTHNEISEYGHGDHSLVRRMVMEMTGRPRAKWTSARVETTTWPVGYSWPTGRTFERHCETDPEEFARLKQHYVSRDCWTWSSEEPLNVDLFQERQSNG